MPAPMTTPTRRALASVIVRPESVHRLHAGGKAVVHERIHLPRFLGRQVVLDIEALHRAAEARRRKALTSKRVMGPMPLSPRQHACPGRRDCAAERRNDAESGDDNAALASRVHLRKKST